jgi:3',5'-cyclic AMP phosphodiesterase CpdA
MKSMKQVTKIIQIVACLVAILSVVACAPQKTYQYESDSALRALLDKPATYPATSFIVVSDLHTYDPSLGTEGKAFEEYISADRKLLKESVELLETASGLIKNENANFVLIPGDLTKDGERASHELVAQYLKQLEASGKKIYVIPGNHDINNGWSYSYTGDTEQRVPNISPEEFVKIYGEFGYNEALFRDPNSLSYVAEPQAGLWLLALDSCRYKENVENQEPITGGKFSPQTLQWIEEMLGKAASEKKPVIAMMHHGVVEHYVGQAKNFPEYLVDDFPAISKLFAEYNVRLVFTGHYHAQDITEKSWSEGNKFLFDVETGSLVTYPCPYRVVNIDNSQKCAIRTERIQSIKSHPQGFQDYARAYLEQGITGIATKAIMGYKVDRAEAEKLAKQVAQAFAAHYAGDEKLPSEQEAIQQSGLSLPGWVVIQFRKNLVYGLWNDLPPPDNNVTLDLKTGGWQ